MKKKTMEKKKIAIIGSVGLPANYGGFETLTEHLVEELSDKYHFTVYCSGVRYKKEERQKTYKGAQLKYIALDANGIQSILYDTFSILHSLLYAEVLLILGVAGAWILPFVKIFTNKKIIISIDGIEWKRNKWSLPAKMYLWWAEKIAVRFSHIDISDNESIQDYTAIRYKTLSRVIEYGADHTLINRLPSPEEVRDFPFLKEKYAVKVCRIEPENNVHHILEAFNKKPAMKFVMVGNWENSEYGRQLKKSYQEAPNITLLDPIYDQNIIDLIRGSAALYVHGHSAGGTNPSLVEAMYLGLPIFSFDVSYNRVTTENEAFYFRNQEDLENLLKNINQEELENCAKKMKKIGERRYTWRKVSQKYDQLIQDSIVVKRKNSIYPKTTNLSDSQLRKYKILHLKQSQLFDN